MIGRAALLVLLALGGCQTATETSLGKTRDTPPTQVLTVQLLGPSGELRGSATLEQRGPGVRVAARVEGLAAGTYAIHLHRIGMCTPPGFESAGPHFNPAMKQHGRDNPLGSHAGDLPNIVVGPAGTGTLSETLAGLALSGGATPLLDTDGAAVVLHAGADDYRTDPSGNSGARIACGALAAR